MVNLVKNILLLILFLLFFPSFGDDSNPQFSADGRWKSDCTYHEDIKNFSYTTVLIKGINYHSETKVFVSNNCIGTLIDKVTLKGKIEYAGKQVTADCLAEKFNYKNMNLTIESTQRSYAYVFGYNILCTISDSLYFGKVTKDKNASLDNKRPTTMDMDKRHVKVFSTDTVSLPKGDIDKLLLDTLKNDNLDIDKLKVFKMLLEKGANPNKIFGNREDDWVMCLANKKENIKFLKLALKYGGKINLRNRVKQIQTMTSAPILCAITHHNKKAFNILLDHGVDLSIHTFEEAKPMPEGHVDPRLWGKTFYGSPLLLASTFNEYYIVYEIMKRKNELTWEELWSLKIDVENGAIDPKSEANQWRLKVIGLLRKKGHDINPERAKKEREKRRAKFKKKNSW